MQNPESMRPTQDSAKQIVKEANEVIFQRASELSRAVPTPFMPFRIIWRAKKFLGGK